MQNGDYSDPGNPWAGMPVPGSAALPEEGQVLEPSADAFTAPLMEPGPFELVAALVKRLHTGILPAFCGHEQTALWKDHRRRAFALLDHE